MTDTGEGNSDHAIRRLADLWASTGNVVVLTGAGLSTASGIPDFRSPGGLWERFRAVTIQEFEASGASREGYWTYKSATWRSLCAAQPNEAHTALTDLGRAGRIELLATQNVDGLHERSGFPAERLIRIHGSDAEAVCLSCGDRRPREDVQEMWNESGKPPCCQCGGWWKPATISFGQSLVAADLQRALNAAAEADLLVAVGSSLVVGPINGMVPLARDAGARVAILTASETPFDDLAEVRISEPVEVVLPAVRDRLLSPHDG